MVFLKQNSPPYPLEIHNNLGGDVGIEKKSDINVINLLKLDDRYMEIHYTLLSMSVYYLQI